jgi:aconitate hydratase
MALSSSCGPCVGSWDRKDVDVRGKEKNSVISSFNRNFVGRHDGNPATHSFVTSPELVTAFAYAGRLDFNLVTDSLLVEGSPVPVRKCTTDHISPAGPWYKYRGHLENTSNNMLTTATNAFLPSGNPEMLGRTRKPITSEVQAVPEVARDLQSRGIKWCIVGDSNYGEGSSREHAALEPRYLGRVAIIARSFARIHETNLKKQGMLPLTFSNPADYDRIQEGDRISLIGVEEAEFQPGKPVTLRVEPGEDVAWEVQLNHSYHAGQIPWLRAGSALNHIKVTIS